MSSRNLLSIVGLVAVGALLAGQVRQLLADPTVWPPDDFVEYWAAATLALSGQNPFDGNLLLPLQQSAGRHTPHPIMMWNPPWALPAVLPLGLLPARDAQLLWALVQFASLGFCADRLWVRLGGARSLRWVSWAVTFTSMPTVLALSSGQISPLLLLGAVLFAECERRAHADRRWEYLAGAATVLVAIKPHLAYLLWVGLAVDGVVRGRWRVLVGGAVAGAACAAVPLAFNPHVWHQYADAMANRPPSQWLSPTLGTVLRMAFGSEHFRLQFVSVAIGLVWFVWYRWQRRCAWDWGSELPLILLVSFCTAPYGAWPFDMVLLLPAVFAVVTKSLPSQLAPVEQRGSVFYPLFALAAVNAGCFVMNLFKLGSFWFLWMAPAVLLIYSLRPRRPRPVERQPAPTAAVPA
ncbi:hypothetical protein GobsT_31730 [Gemmata obscuriglobus]|uniref:DUF2029 domain-containing protein n=1 Tax=Gemmata obscuriglobus TaxID=114 RepID=A0A2Z3H4Z6_9BACT|nr:glycosyltransferase family 87 protein [Gemmata obscuriglobus]AWM38646.1 DUF2029 domain-containing protein [Gemmata obscuriglobus]QEG28395.1 hypothetical protein GobsT_31730 [Gemmata obscuriglobus]VTS06327.1 hypothetical protein : Uncharacterized protein OS=Smithella sp. SCADC GN=ER57_03545 PE=4 SV=1: DUF2029 [Gemmata obscuriglobus UQM 2246]